MSEQIAKAAKSAWFWVGLIVSVCTLSLGIVQGAGFAKAATVAQQGEDIAALKAAVQVVPVMAAEVRTVFEIERAEQYRLHHIIIPDPAAPADGGAR